MPRGGGSSDSLLASVASFGEDRLIALLGQLVEPQYPCKLLPFFDDAWCVGDIVVNIDGYSFRDSWLPWLSPYEYGWRAAVASMSDVVAKAAKPLAAVASLGVRPGDSVLDVVRIVEGVRDSLNVHGAWLLGGDINRSREGWIDIATIAVKGAPKVLPQTVKPNTLIYATSYRLWYAGLVLHSFYTNRWTEAREMFPEAFERFTRPILPTKFIELVRLAPSCIVGASDVSDSLAYTLWNIARRSKLAIKLANIEPPPEAVEYSKQYGVDLLHLLLYGGEEYDIVFAVEKRCSREVEERAFELGLKVVLLGEAVEEETGVYIGGSPIEPRGWRHFYKTH